MDAIIQGNNIIISKDSFEHIMNCLANQKFINESPQNGDSMAEGSENYYNKQQEMQDVINDCWNHGMKLLASDSKV